MKFNLKQRKRMIKDDEEIQGLEKRDIIQGYEEWFEGFEKELRETLEWTKKKWHPRTAYNRGMKAECIYRLQQILGDET
jgi:hypothetical protein